MSNGKQSRDYDAEIADIVKIAEQYHAQAPLVTPTQSDNLLMTPTNMKLTPNEVRVLQAIDASEYGDFLQDEVWTFSVTQE
jgi:hypothetical protein